MKHRIIVEPGAQRDIIEIKQWYRLQQPGLEISFVNELKEFIKLIAENPFLFQFRYKALRAFTMKRFPYLGYYFISKNEIHILAVLAAKQDQHTLLKNR